MTPSPPWKRRLLLTLGTLVLVGLGGALGFVLWIRVPPIPSDTETAVALFSRVMNGEDALEAQALGSLAGAIDHAPSDGRAQLYFGLANLHGFLRGRELPYAIRASRAFDRAVELSPEDTSAAGWRAFWRYQAGRTRGQDLDLLRDELLLASERDPRFTPFLAAVALAPMPLSTGYPRRVLEPLARIGDCGDGTSYSCRTGPLFPHGAEGYHATLGDLLARLGDVEAGRAEYARALEMPSAGSWPYREAFEAWTEGVEERSRLLTNEEASDDPPIFFMTGDRACAGCHRR
jgi:hypothetical protein